MIRLLWSFVHKRRRGHWPPVCYYRIPLCCPVCDHEQGYNWESPAP